MIRRTLGACALLLLAAPLALNSVVLLQMRSTAHEVQRRRAQASARATTRAAPVRRGSTTVRSSPGAKPTREVIQSGPGTSYS